MSTVQAPLRRPPARLLRDPRALVSAASLVLSAALTALVLAGVGGPARVVCGLLFVLFVPGWALVGQLRLRNAAAEFSLAMVVSLAVVMAAAQLMLALHLWRPLWVEPILAVAAAPLLVRRMLRTSMLRRVSP